jgi:serine/threonine-protein kinase
VEQAARNFPGTSGASHGEPQAGDIIAGKYLIEKVIGRGGMGRVLAAVHTTTGKRVALKWILNEESEEARERFSREAKAAGRIHHANVVDVYDVLEHDGAMCLVMELLRGESLASLLAREHTLSADVAVPLAVQIARGLHAAHQEGVIHRDLKPGNIFLTDGQGESGVKLLDFGISKILDAPDGEPVTKSGAVLGTPHYMAPEQVLGMGGSDVRVDVYALGAVLYEMLAGRPPHTHEKLTALLVQIATVPTEPITELVQGLSPMLGTVIMKALTKNPADRYPTVVAFAQALEAFTDVRFDGASGERRVRLIDRSDPEGLGTPSHVATLQSTPTPTTAPERRDSASHHTPETRQARALNTPTAGPPRPLVSGPVVAGLVALALLGGLAVLRPWESADPEPASAVPAPVLALPSSPPSDPGDVAPRGLEHDIAPAEADPGSVALETLPEPVDGPRIGRRVRPRGPAEANPAAEPASPVVEAPVVEAPTSVSEPPVPEAPATIRRTETPRAGRIGLDDF